MPETKAAQPMAGSRREFMDQIGRSQGCARVPDGLERWQGRLNARRRRAGRGTDNAQTQHSTLLDVCIGRLPEKRLGESSHVCAAAASGPGVIETPASLGYGLSEF